MIARAVDGVFADHVKHLLVAFDERNVMFEDLADVSQ